ncbi:MAG: FKBP-type peptidyl-prolyl cis-trans isomerase [Chloroflexota bacterium]
MSDSTVSDGQVVSMEYTLRVDGSVVDTSEGREPLQYLHGAGNIISGLESQMTGMALGESRDVVVAAKDGYGETNPQAFMDVNRGEFPADMPIKAGLEMELSDQNGQPLYARVESVEGDVVRLNMNHPLAGKELHFNVKVVALRAATDEERAHGHAHGAHHH